MAGMSKPMAKSAPKTNMSKAPAPALRYGEKKAAPAYKIPAAPKSSGAGWGGEKPSKKK